MPEGKSLGKACSGVICAQRLPHGAAAQLGARGPREGSGSLRASDSKRHPGRELSSSKKHSCENRAQYLAWLKPYCMCTKTPRTLPKFQFGTSCERTKQHALLSHTSRISQGQPSFRLIPVRRSPCCWRHDEPFWIYSQELDCAQISGKLLSSQSLN